MKGLFKDTVTMLTFIGTNKILYLLLTILIARKLGVEGVGAYGFVLAFTGLFFVFVRIGTGVAVRELASDTRKASLYFWNTMLLMFTIGVTVFALLTITLHFYPTSAEIKKAVYLYGFCLFFSILSGPAKIVFYALKRFRFYAVTEIIGDVAAVSAAIVFILFGKGLIGIIIGFIIGEAASAMFSHIILWKKIIAFPGQLVFDFMLLKRFISKGFYFVTQDILRSSFFKMDILVLSLFKGVFLIGIYQAASKISSSIFIIPDAIKTVMYPEYAAKFIHSPKFLKKDYCTITLYNFLIAVLLYGLILLFPDVIVYYIYGYKFAAAVPIIKILAIAMILNVLNRNNNIFLNAIREEKLTFYLIFLVFILNAATDLLLVQKYGIKGIAIASVFYALVYFMISTTLIVKKIKNVSKLQTLANYGHIGPNT